jgi:DNA-binding NarL/FixJ family response regulator
MKRSPIVAIINADESVAGRLSGLLRNEGYQIVTEALARLVFRPDDSARFFTENDPDVVIYDLSPFDESVRFLEYLRGARMGSGRTFVLTTTCVHENADVMRLAIDLRNSPHAGETLLEEVRRGTTAGRRERPEREPKAA